ICLRAAQGASGPWRKQNMRTIMQKRLRSALSVTVLSSGTILAAFPALALDQSVVTPKGMIVAGHPLAVESGLKVLRAGGTACDAFVATAATLSITLTDMMGPLGSGFALVYTPDGENKNVQAI